MTRVESCKTCRFCEVGEPMNCPPYSVESLCARYPQRTATPGWCGEWRPDGAKLCKARKMWLKGKPASKIGDFEVPGFPPHFHYCYLGKQHDGEHTDGAERWPDVECYKEGDPTC